MSVYTDRSHEAALRQTLYWQAKKPETSAEIFQYGEYLFGLKDYRNAVLQYVKAAKLRNISAMYTLAYCMKMQQGCAANPVEEARLFREVIENDLLSNEKKAAYRLGMCYTYGFGTAIDMGKGFSYFQKISATDGHAMYELGLFYKLGKNGMVVDLEQAEKYFRQAYDADCEQAIFDLYEVYSEEFSNFPYKRELTQAYAFKLGRLLRVAEVNPSKDALNRLAEFYQKGFPGDDLVNIKKFRGLADSYRQQADSFVD